METIAVVYWSGTGNTLAMAEAVAQACGGALIEAGSFSPEQIASYDAIAFGCPSMGTEELEESVFAPLFEACKPLLQGKKLALFGSSNMSLVRGSYGPASRIRIRCTVLRTLSVPAASEISPHLSAHSSPMRSPV